MMELNESRACLKLFLGRCCKLAVIHALYVIQHTPVLYIATWVMPLENSHSFNSVKELVKVPNKRVSFLRPPPSSGRRYRNHAVPTERMIRLP